uniref:Uncharacterized protein n=1 Tax=Cannabis sativa TaxID=3483 RepID=A0A803QXG2_CANSA
MEIPSQYKATLELNILGCSRGKAIDRVPLPPPNYGSASGSASKRPNSYRPSAPTAVRNDPGVSRATPASSASDNHVSLPNLSYRSEGYGIWLWPPDMLRVRPRS